MQQPNVPQQEQGDKTPGLVERAQLILELYKTEVKYVQVLDNLVRYFLGPLKEQPEILGDQNKRRKMFPSALVTLFSVHSEFLTKFRSRLTLLKERGDGSQRKIFFLGDLFLEMTPYFKLYPTYVSDFEQQSKLIKEERASNPAFAAFLEKQFKLLNDPSQDLASMLITPIQRLPRYLLLLRNVRRSTPPNHLDYENLERACSEIESIVVMIDQKAKDAENVSALSRLTETFKGIPELLFDGSRRFRRMSVVHIGRSSKSPKERALLILSDYVVFGKPGKDSGMYEYMEGFPLEDSRVCNEEQNGEWFTFELICGRGSDEKIFVVHLKKQDEAHSLFVEFDHLIREVKLKSTTLRRKERSGSQRGSKIVSFSSSSTGNINNAAASASTEVPEIPSPSTAPASSNASGGGGSRIGRAIGAVGKAISHRRTKSGNQSPQESPTLSPLGSPKGEPQSPPSKVVAMPQSPREPQLSRGSTKSSREARKSSKGSHRRAKSSATYQDVVKGDEEAPAVKPPSHFRRSSSSRPSTDVFFESMSGFDRESVPRVGSIDNLNWDEI